LIRDGSTESYDHDEERRAHLPEDFSVHHLNDPVTLLCQVFVVGGQDEGDFLLPVDLLQ
jgi:hypothetical protein